MAARNKMMVLTAFAMITTCAGESHGDKCPVATDASGCAWNAMTSGGVFAGCNPAQAMTVNIYLSVHNMVTSKEAACNNMMAGMGLTTPAPTAPLAISGEDQTTIDALFTTCAAKNMAECTGDCSCDGAGTCGPTLAKLFEIMGITSTNSFFPLGVECGANIAEAACNANPKCMWDSKVQCTMEGDGRLLREGSSSFSVRSPSFPRELAAHTTDPECTVDQDLAMAMCAGVPSGTACNTYTFPSYCDPAARCGQGDVKTASKVDPLSAVSAECKAAIMTAGSCNDSGTCNCAEATEECSFSTTMTSGNIKCTGDSGTCGSSLVTGLITMFETAMAAFPGNNDKTCVPTLCTDAELQAYLDASVEVSRKKEDCQVLMNKGICNAQLGLVALGNSVMTCPSRTISKAMDFKTGGSVPSGNDASSAFGMQLTLVIPLVMALIL